ncbi:NUDIX hydrolase [Corallincola platygyrae]|uniref:NUDIX hydrolase n=1 Tax=Corallincola platygyrae TaxID=1193278 RepID=A0ABW4XJM9_9GAMM
MKPLKLQAQLKDKKSSAHREVQIGAVPFLIENNQLKVVLVTSRSGRQWLFPKGHDELHMTRKGVARTEAYEEAGLLGSIGPKRYTVTCLRRCHGRLRLHTFYPMEVTYLLPKWPEMHQRRRKVVSIAKAMRMLSCSSLKSVLAEMLAEVKPLRRAA